MTPSFKSKLANSLMKQWLFDWQAKNNDICQGSKTGKIIRCTVNHILLSRRYLSKLDYDYNLKFIIWMITFDTKCHRGTNQTKTCDIDCFAIGLLNSSLYTLGVWLLLLLIPLDCLMRIFQGFLVPEPLSQQLP